MIVYGDPVFFLRSRNSADDGGKPSKGVGGGSGVGGGHGQSKATRDKAQPGQVKHSDGYGRLYGTSYGGIA